jgi:hypothetical protein
MKKISKYYFLVLILFFSCSVKTEKQRYSSEKLPEGSIQGFLLLNWGESLETIKRDVNYSFSNVSLVEEPYTLSYRSTFYLLDRKIDLLMLSFSSKGLCHATAFVNFDNKVDLKNYSTSLSELLISKYGEPTYGDETIYHYVSLDSCSITVLVYDSLVSIDYHNELLYKNRNDDLKELKRIESEQKQKHEEKKIEKFKRLL